MFALSLYAGLIFLVGVRVRVARLPVLLTPKTIAVLHLLYVLFLLYTWGREEQIFVGALAALLIGLPLVLLKKTLVMPFDQAFIDQQILDSCRMLRIDVKQEDGVYVLTTKAGESRLSINKIALGTLLGTISTRQPKGGDVKVVLLGKLLKKKFASVVPHITINLNKHDANK